MIRALCLAAIGLTTCGSVAQAAEPAITAMGVIGNTGGQGAALIRQATDYSFRGHGHVVGCGLALDRRGSLWTRMDEGAITRLTLDGRQLASFTAPASTGPYDTLTMLGDHVLLLASGELLALPIEAPAGSAFTPLGVKLRAIAHTPVAGRLAAITEESAIVWVKPDGRPETIAGIPDAWIIEADGSGNLYVGTKSEARSHDDGQLRKLTGGKEVTGGGWPKAWAIMRPGIAMPGQFLQWDGDGFFTGGTSFMSHYDADANPSPGTVLGMQGNYVIGVGADWREELAVSRGIVRIRPGLYAIGGAWGQPFFAEWPDMTKSMRLVSWFTARPDCQALNIDADGNVFADRLVYAWNATPDSFPVQVDGSSLTSQIARGGPNLMIRQDRWNHGDDWALPLHSGPRMESTDWLNKDKVDKAGWWDRYQQSGIGVLPAVAYPEGEWLTFLCLADATGARSLRLAPTGRLIAPGGPVAFRTAQAGKELTSLAMADGKVMLAAIDGQVVEFTASGSDWQEKRRWNSWGSAAGDSFGKKIRIACDRNRLVVSDEERNRVLWFSATGGKPKAVFGAAAGGNDLRSFDHPGLIAVYGDRAVVHDAANQRLVKLLLSE